MYQEEIQKFCELVVKPRYAGFANATVTRLSEKEVEVISDHGEDRTKHRVLITWIDDEYIDITRYNANNEIIHHAIIFKEDVSCEHEVPYKVIDINTAFSGDGDCGIMMALDEAIGFEESWKHTINNSKTMCEKLDEFIEDCKNPNVCFSPEELAHRIVNEIVLRLEDDEE